MRPQLSIVLGLALLGSAPAFARTQEPRHEEPKQGQSKQAPPKQAPPKHVDKNPPRANGGHIPPPPPRREDPHAAREPQHYDDGRSSDRPHVSNDHWYGHDAPDDKRFHLDHPYQHGHFAHFGPSYRYTITRVDVNAHRFWFPGGFYFEVAPWDWAQCSAWCWQCGNDFVIYEDSDHAGWYLLYNVHTGVYVHVLFLGH